MAQLLSKILCDCWYYKASINLECILSKGMFKWGNTRTELGQKELEGQREELTERINLLEAKRRDAQAQYERLTRENRPLQTRRTALLQVKSFDRRIEGPSIRSDCIALPLYLLLSVQV